MAANIHKSGFCVLLAILLCLNLSVIDAQSTAAENEEQSCALAFEEQRHLLYEITKMQDEYSDFRQRVETRLETLASYIETLSRALKDESVERKQEQEGILNGLNFQNQTLQNHYDAYGQCLKVHDDVLSREFERHDETLQLIGHCFDNFAQLLRNQSQLSTILLNDVCRSIFTPFDCADVRAAGHSTDGIYRVYINRRSIEVYCDMTTNGGNWMVFQRRESGRVDFYRTWREYAGGFGNQTGEFWLGNEILHQITSKRNYKLRIDLEDFNGYTNYIEYSRFSIGSSANNYQLDVSGYLGKSGDSLTGLNGMPFTTKDANNDPSNTENLAEKHEGAWWYKRSTLSNLNGRYLHGSYWSSKHEGIYWYHYRGLSYSLKKTEMKIAPAT